MSTHLKEILQKFMAMFLALLMLVFMLPFRTLKASAATALPVAIQLNSFSSDILSGASGNTLLEGESGSAAETGQGLPEVTSDKRLHLTNCVGNESGTVVRRNRMTLKGGFSTFFQIDINGGNEADGLSFIIYQASSNNNYLSIGAYGSGVGYAGIPNSLAVEFDTYTNSSGSESKNVTLNGQNKNVSYNLSDPNSPHVAIDVNGIVCHDNSTSSTSNSSSNPTNDGTSNVAHVDSGIYASSGHAYTNVWVDYGTDGYVTVTYGSSTERTSSSNYSFKRCVGTALLNSDVYVGFAASTGGSYENHYVNQWDFQNSYVSGGLSQSGDYIAEASSASITLNSSSNNPTSASIQLYNPDGGKINYSDPVNIYIDNTLVKSTSTNDAGALTYTIPDEAAGSHTLKVATADGSAVNTSSFNVTVPTYAVSYTAGANGTLRGSSSENVQKGSHPSSVPEPVPNSGYSFSGWSPSTPADTVINAATKFTANFSANTYALKFYDDKGNSLSSNYPNVSVTYGTKISTNLADGTLPSPTRTGYTFTGWSTGTGGTGKTLNASEIYTSAGDTSLYEDWTANTYALSFDSQGGSAVSGQNASYGSAVGSLPVPARGGYTFNGWYTGKNGTGTRYTSASVYQQTGGLLLYADWTANTYTISFDPQGGSAVSGQNAAYGSAVGTLPVSVRDGYTFTGWYTGKNGTGTRYTADNVYSTADDTTLYACWLADAVAPTVTSPRSAVYDVGDTSVLRVTANAADGGTLTYQWQRSTDGKTFTDIQGATGSSYTTTALSVSDNGALYRCVVINSKNGTTAQTISAAAVLSVNSLVISVENKIDSLPDPVTSSDQQILDSQQNIVNTKQEYDQLDATGKDAVGLSRQNKLNSLIYRLNSLLVIIPKDKDTGIIAGNLGTAIVIPEINGANVGKVVVKLMVNPVGNTSQPPANIQTATATLSKNGRSIVEAYDISLFKTVYDGSGTKLSYGKISNSNIVGAVTVMIPVPSKYAGRSDLQVVYIDNSGNVTPLSTSIVTSDGVQYLRFTTTHFSEYAVTIAKTAAKEVANPATGDNQNSFPKYWLLLLYVPAGSVFLINSRRKKRSRYAHGHKA